MKFILPLLICVFITGCTFTSINNNKNVKKNKKDSTIVTKKISKKAKEEVKSDVFSTEFDDKEEHVYSNLNNTIIDIADQLFQTRTDKKNPTRVILTSFVDLNKLGKSSTFGRLISESMFNELHIRKFFVTDFRGQDAVSVTEDGEFHITRDVEKLKDKVDAVEYILVGTYVKFEDQSLLINARILDSESGRVESSARVVYRPRDCSLFGICKDTETNYDLFEDSKQKNNTINTKENSTFSDKKQVINMNARENSKFSIIADNCKDRKCDK